MTARKPPVPSQEIVIREDVVLNISTFRLHNADKRGNGMCNGNGENVKHVHL